MRLRPYQLAAGAAWAEARAANPAARGLVVLPTGCGKTALGLWIASTSGRTLWLAHRDELIQQPVKALWEHHPSLEVGAVAAKEDAWGARDVVVGSVQTLARPKRLAKLVDGAANGAGPFSLVVVDEAHHAVAESYRGILGALPDTPVIGLTATPERADEISLREVFDDIVFRYPIAEAQARGWLVPHVAMRVTADELDVEMPEEGAAREEQVAAIVAAIVECVLTTVGQRRTLVFVPRVDISIAVAEGLNARGMTADHIDGTIAKGKRRKILERHRGGAYQTLINCAVLTEGYDDPAIAAVVMARATTSRSVYLQCVGRGLRTRCCCGKAMTGQPCSCAKDDCLIVDLVGAHEAHGLVTAETLDPASGEVPDSVGDVGDESAMLGLLGLDAEPVDDTLLAAFIAALKGERDLSRKFGQADTAWIEIDAGCAYSLSAGDLGTLIVELTPEGWDLVQYPRSRSAPALVVDGGGSLDDALRASDRMLRAAKVTGLVNQAARWRKRRASEGQLQALKKWRVPVPDDRTITMGEASYLLDRAAAGATYRRRAKRSRVMSAARVCAGWG